MTWLPFWIFNSLGMSSVSSTPFAFDLIAASWFKLLYRNNHQTRLFLLERMLQWHKWMMLSLSSCMRKHNYVVNSTDWLNRSTYLNSSRRQTIAKTSWELTCCLGHQPPVPSRQRPMSLPLHPSTKPGPAHLPAEYQSIVPFISVTWFTWDCSWICYDTIK